MFDTKKNKWEVIPNKILFPSSFMSKLVSSYGSACMHFLCFIHLPCSMSSLLLTVHSLLPHHLLMAI